MPTPTTNWPSLFAGRDIVEIIYYIGTKLNGTSFSELSSMYQRALDVAFHEPQTSNRDRASAATWANALESLILLSLVGREELIEQYSNARNLSQRNAENHGYGSLSYFVHHGSAGQADDEKSIPAAQIEHNEKIIALRREFLLSIAFGRTEDSKVSGA